ncbi:helix-turn-helix domain-containing protein [Candidatus Woesearchaeota archaeon]|jgi:predicted transcriptional regulator|nr:helix-turn-helix domain-containing protein [Candidatus Woesearchaeota archaeon]MBT7062502.1 helix-turn-helix domain-containing protein [Candidatus Woesearchaeota archaeon]MBT7402557.1 helix-turn-helix domain-containing protein [Candidatus Woesearchaeota archaeon]
MIDQKLLETVFDEKIIGVINALLNQDTDFFSIREISEKADVTVSTTFRIVQSLEAVGFVKKIKRGRIKFFQIQKASKSYKQLAELLGQKIDIYSIIRNKIGEEVELFTPKKDKNKIFIITEEDIDDSELSKEITATSNKKIKLMSISPQQFQKMKTMGLIQ